MSSSGRRSSSGTGSGRKKGSGKKGGQVIDLTVWQKFGFTPKSASPKAAPSKAEAGGKKRPPPVDGGAAAGGDAEVEIVAGPAEKRARTPAAAVSRDNNATKSKVGSGKENPVASAGKPSASTVSATPAKTNTSAGMSGEKSGGGSRLALLDLTGDSSENSAGSAQPAAKAPAKATPAKGRATLTLGDMGGGMASEIWASSKHNHNGSSKPGAATGAASANGAKPRQRRGKRDRQPPSASKGSKPEGATKSGAMDPPISIFEDGAPKEPPAKAPKREAQPSRGRLLDRASQLLEGTNATPAAKGGAANGPSEPKFAERTVVDVHPRTWPGRNDPGGVARITRVRPASEHDDGIVRYDVKYIIDSRKERGVEETWIKLHEEYSPERGENKGKREAEGRGRSPGKRRVSPTEKARGRNSGGKGTAKGARKDPPEQARSKSPAKKGEGPKKGVVREGSIQSYFSPPGKAAIKMGNSPAKKPSPKASPNGTVGAASPRASPKASPKGPPRRYHALALVKVPDHGRIHCTTAVARARGRLFDPNANDYVEDCPADERAYRVEDGTVLGRPSPHSATKPNFVDIGLPRGAPGISRNHVKVVKVEGLFEPGSDGSGDAAAAAAKATVQFQALSNPLELIFKQRGHHWSTIELHKGGCKTISVGDTISFKTQDEDRRDRRLHYCVVGLVFAPGAADGKGDAATAKAGAEEDEEVAAAEAKRALDFTTPHQERMPKSMLKTSATRKLAEPIEIDDDGEETGGGREALPKRALADDRNFSPSAPEIDAATTSAAKAMLSSRTTEIPTKLPPADAAAAMDDVEDAKRDEDASGKKLGVAPKLAARAVVQEASQTQSIDESVYGDDASEAAPIEPIKKGDCVKVLYDENPDMFGNVRNGWYLGRTMGVKVASGGSSHKEINVGFDDGTSTTCRWPSADVEKVADLDDYYPAEFRAGDVVDAFFQNGGYKGRWYRGRIAEVRKDTCDIVYYDKEFEANVPTNDKKIRLIRRDAAEEQSWVIGKDATVKWSDVDSDTGDGFRTGVVSHEPSNDRFRITFAGENGAAEAMEVSYEEAAKAVLVNFKLEEVPLSKQYVWPVSSTENMAETVRLRRQRREEQKRAKAPVEVKTEVKQEPKPAARGRRGKTGTAKSSSVSVKEEPVDADEMEDDVSLVEEVDNDMSDDERLLLLPVQGGPAVDPELLENRTVAKDFPPGLPNVLWCALNSPEPRTGYNFLRELLTVHDSIPPTNLVSKLMELMKYGPRAEGSSTVHFKDPNRTELASAYVYSLVRAQKRFVRRGESPAIFGPSTWDDVEVLLSQSIAQTENAISGRRLAHALQLAARGARLMELMLKTELQGYDLYVTPDAGTFDAESLQGMPTVRLMKSYGVRSALKATVGHATRCLVRHSRWILGQDRDSKDAAPRGPNDEGCALEARACLESLGSAVCTVSWMLCAEEGIDISSNPTECAFVIKDEFLVRMESSLDELPDMSKRARDKFVKRLKLYFLLSLREDFAEPLVATLAKMIGVEWR